MLHYNSGPSFVSDLNMILITCLILEIWLGNEKTHLQLVTNILILSVENMTKLPSLERVVKEYVDEKCRKPHEKSIK